MGIHNAVEKIRMIPVDLITPDRNQARKHFDQAALEELARSIRDSGVIQPVVVRTVGRGFELLAGERRWRASQIAGLHEIPSIVRDDLGEDEAIIIGLIENLQRESLPPLDAAMGMQRLGEVANLTHGQIGDRIGKSREYVANFLRLLNLAPAVAALVNQGQLSPAHGKVLASLPKHEQMPLAKEAISTRMTVRVIEKRVAQLKCAKPSGLRMPSSKGSDHSRLEQNLSDLVGYPVQVVESKPGAGEVRLRYTSLEELDGILERLGYRAD